MLAGGDIDSFDKIYEMIKNKNDTIEDLITDLLNFENETFVSYKIPKEVRFVLIFHLIRNFAAHNVVSINFIGKNFQHISQKLFFLLLIILRRKRKKLQ